MVKTKKQEQEKNSIEIITPKEFLKQGHSHWLESHWSLAGTYEQAKKWFEDKGFEGEIYAMTYDNLAEETNPSIFGWWMPTEE